MAILNKHGYVSTTSCACWDVDSLNVAGIATVDLDNGVFVTLNNMAQDASNNIEGYQFNVAPATADTTGPVWLVNSPEVGTTLDQQLLSDPRYFYNEAGKAMSLKYLLPHADCIEVTAETFVNGTLPTTATSYITIGAGGKLVAQAAAPTTAGQPYFTFVGNHTVAIGMELVPTVILRCAVNG